MTPRSTPITFSGSKSRLVGYSVGSSGGKRAAIMFFILILSLVSPIAQSDVASVLPQVYSESGFHDKWRQKTSTLNEHIDPFGGSLGLSHTDLVVPGAGGLDIRINRQYTSNIWLSRPNPFSIPPYPTVLLPSGPAGVGWTMHFGRVVRSASETGVGDGICDTNQTDPNDTTLNNAVLELPDGSQDILVVNETFYGDNGVKAALFATKKYWVANCLGAGQGLIVYSPDGLRYIMDYAIATLDEVTYTTRMTRAWYPTRIEDGNGNYLQIAYSGVKGSHALISTITASDGRLVNFGYTNGQLTSVTANNQTWTYVYEDLGLGQQLLKQVIRPDGLAWQYSYNPSSAAVGRYAMQSVTYPYGATVSYTYNHVDFVGNVALIGGDPLQKYLSVVVASKTQAGREVEPGTWTYSYAPGTENTIEPSLLNDSTTVTFPGGKYVYKHYGMQRQLGIASLTAQRELWRTGLLKEKEIYTESGGVYSLVQKETYEWPSTTGVLSFEDFVLQPYNYIEFGVYLPELASKTVVRDGTTYRTDYDYQCGTGKCIQPQFTTETGQAGTAQASSRRTDLRWYPATTRESATPGVWKFNQTTGEAVDNPDFTLTRLNTVREFNLSTGNMSAIQKRGVIERYTYHNNGDVATKQNNRGWFWSYIDYHRGVPRQEVLPVASNETITIMRQVNDTGTVLSETNGRQFTTNYQYDGMNRPTFIDRPINSDVTVVWNTTGRSVARGNYLEQTVYDGFGRVICMSGTDTTRGDQVTQVTRYNALGNKSFSSYPFSGTCASAATGITGDSLSTDVLGRATQVVHADGTAALHEYLPENVTRVTNERNKVTTYRYRSFGDPDKADERVLMRIDAPENVSTVFTRNVIGQIETVTQGGVTRSYTYDLNKNYLLTVTNPETGVTTYTRDEMGNMRSRRVGASAISYFYYDAQDRLRIADYPGTLPDAFLDYDQNNNLTSLQTSNGYPDNTVSYSTTRLYSYDANDNLSSESQEVAKVQVLLGTPTLLEKHTATAGYGYDGLDHLTSTTYPSGRVVTFTPDAFGRTRQVSPHIGGVTYYPSGQPASVDFANGRQALMTLNPRQWVESISTSGSVATGPITGLTYGYDGRGNVRTINDTGNGNNRILDYDGIDRLITANGVWGAGGVTYDTVGNIRSMSVGNKNLNYTYDAANRLSNVGGNRNLTISYDIYGNVAGNGANTFAYDDAGNLAAVGGATSAEYVYDGKNMRVRESKGLAVTYYFYAKNGNLLGEYDKDPLKWKEYAYLGGKMVALVRPGNQIPVANAGLDKSVYEGTAVTLDGSASSDIDGQISSYAWTQTAGPNVALSGSNTAIVSFTAPQVAVQTLLIFRLTVTDNKGESSSDTVNINVFDLSADLDGDGLPDGWEMFYFGNLNQGPNGDPDGDGLTNLQEYLQGSNPTVASPPAVSSITAVPGDGQNTLGWMGVSGATQYNLYWKATPGVTKANGTKVAGISYPVIHPGLTNGVNYYYVITAVNNTEESALSPEVSAKPGTRAWGSAALIENDDSAAASTPQIAMDALGNATAVWIQGGRTWANRYSVNGSWGVPVLIETSTQPASDPRVAMDAYGNAMAIWRQSDGTRNNLWSSYYQTGVGWGQPVLVEYYDGTYVSQGEVGDVESPQLVMNPAGLAVAVWLQQDARFDSTGGGYIVDTVYVNSFWPGVGWGSRRMIDTTDIGPSYAPKVAVATNGAIVVTWSRATSPNGLFLTSEFIYANHFIVNTGWTGPVMLATNNNTSSIDLDEPNAALDGNGNPMVVWRETKSANSGTNYYIWANSKNAGAWGTPTLLVSPNNKDYAAKTQVIMDANGNAQVAWIQTGSAKGNRVENIDVKRYSVSGGWGSTASVGNDGYIVPDFSLKQDMSGNALLVWWQSTAANSAHYDVFYRQYQSAGWSAPALLESGSGSALNADLAMNPSGDAIAVWQQSDGTRDNIWANRYAVPISGGGGGSNTPPVANAGPDQTAKQQTPVSLNGSASSDSDGSIVSYAWRQVSGKAVTLSNPTAAIATFTAPRTAKTIDLIFELVVTDNKGATAADQVKITVVK